MHTMESLTRTHVRLLVAALLLLSLPAFLAPTVGPAVSALVREVDAANPYLAGTSPGLLYIGLPLSVGGAMVLVMAPGLLAVLALGRGRNVFLWVLEGFALSLGAVSVVTALVQTVIGRPLTGGWFVALVLGLICGAGVLLYRRVAHGHPTPWPLVTWRSRLVLASLIVVPLLFLVPLTPKFFWESFNGDGAHAFVTARLLLHQPLPFWALDAGAVVGWPGVNGVTVPYVPSWFVRLFGEYEAGARLPLILYLPLLFSAAVALAEAGRDMRLKAPALVLMWSGIISFALVMAYSATYNPYAADIAMPATQDFLVMIFCFGAMVAFDRRDILWLAIWTLLALMTSPASLPVLGLLLAAWFVSTRPLPWRNTIAMGIGLVACLLFLAGVPVLLGAVGIMIAGSEHSPVSLFLRQFEYMAVADFERFLWVALPTGVYPIAGLFGWRGRGSLTRALIVLTVALFAMYYVMATLSLHYFVPVMLLPLIIFWRKHGSRSLGRLPLALCGAGAAMAIWMALPAGTGIYDGSRVIGESIDVSAVEDYNVMDPAAFRASRWLGELFLTSGRPEVPEEAYGGSPLAWMYYASRVDVADAPKNYVLAPADTEPPDGAVEIAGNDEVAVHVYDIQRWESDRTYQPGSSLGKAVYIVPRAILFFRGEDSVRPGYFRARSVVARLLGRGN